jgi:LPS-assembly lipoprotein
MMKNLLALASILIVTACGFTPMYGSSATTGKSVTAGLDKVEIAMIANAEGVYLRNALIDRFYQSGYPSSPAYRLVVTPIAELKRDLDITIESEATRRQIYLSTTMTLIDTKSGESVLSRSLSAITSYNVLGTQFTTRISENDAREAALNDLARQIEMQVSLHLKK